MKQTYYNLKYNLAFFFAKRLQRAATYMIKVTEVALLGYANAASRCVTKLTDAEVSESFKGVGQ